MPTDLGLQSAHPAGGSVGAVVRLFGSCCWIWFVLLELNEPLIRLATMAIAEGPRSSSSLEPVGGAIAISASATSPTTDSREDHVARFRKCAAVWLLRRRVRENTSQTTDLCPIGLLVSSFAVASSKLRTRVELRSSARSVPSTNGDKLHKIKAKDNGSLTCRSARVKGIGPERPNYRTSRQLGSSPI